MPVLSRVFNDLLLVRLILHPDVSNAAPWLDTWAGRVAGLLAQGTSVWMMIHCPNNQHCPPFAADFHARLQQAMVRAGLPRPPDLPPWPVPQQDLPF